MYFTLEALPARKGDCLLLHYGSARRPKLAVIDAGPANVYEPHLRPRLNDIREARDLPHRRGLPIDLLMVSHVDDDHINGILEMTAELAKAKLERRPLAYAVKVLWHNSFDDIIGNRPEDLQASITSQFGAASFGGEIPTDIDDDEPDSDDSDPDNPRVGFDAAMVLSSVRQGHQLRADIRRLGLSVNNPFDELIINRGKRGSTADLKGGVKLKVVGPMKAQLLALQKKHDKWLKKKQLRRTSREAALAAFSDPSVPNLSSIVVMAQSGDKTILLTGDARGDKILTGLENAGLLHRHDRMHVNVLKLPHHGSENNVAPEFFDRIRADHYVASGNGEHGNPERDTFEMLFNVRGNEEFTIHLTYPVDEIDAERKREHNKKHRQGKRQHRWSDWQNSLASLFRSKHRAGARFSLNEAGQDGRVAIPLRDAIPF
jgi:hypothetical protein